MTRNDEVKIPAATRRWPWANNSRHQMGDATLGCKRDERGHRDPATPSRAVGAEESTVVDERMGVSPAQSVSNKLATLLKKLLK